jgi:hypothetical protein
MLIWKTIKANPGITRDQLWKRVEHGIPEGYALRRYAAELKAIERRSGRTPNGSGVRLTQARGYVLTHALARLRGRGSVVRVDGCYSALRQPDYRGNLDVIDVDGTKAAEHLAVADALVTVEKWLAGANPDRPLGPSGRRGGVLGPPSRKQYEALVIVARALRAKGSAE